MNTSPQSPAEIPKDGLALAIAAFFIWGFFPVYFKLLDFVPSEEMLAHRIFWALPFGALILFFRRQWKDVKTAFTSRSEMGLLVIAALMIAINWGVYVYATQHGNILQASLGYYINPLMFVAVGMFMFGERLTRLQIIAICLAACGVGYLIVLGGEVPWISLILATSWTIYGVARKRTSVGAMPGLFIETAILWPLCAAYLFWLGAQGTGQFTMAEPGLAGWLIFAGPMTVVPLLFFAIATRKLPLSLIGILQYIGPSLQFACAIYFGEPLTPARIICFVFIWSAVSLFCLSAWRGTRARQRSVPAP